MLYPLSYGGNIGAPAADASDRLTRRGLFEQTNRVIQLPVWRQSHSTGAAGSSAGEFGGIRPKRLNGRN